MSDSLDKASEGTAAKSHLRIVAHYEDCLARYGDTHRGVDWPNPLDAALRYRVMLDLVLGDRGRTTAPAALLDFGCGAGHFLEFLREHAIPGIDYRGIDLSERFILLCRSKFPGVTFHHLDVLEPAALVPTSDYIIANGVFTEKRDLSFEEMMAYFQAMLRKLWPAARRGMAFNLMSAHVEQQRDILFHVPLDRLATFLTGEISRHLAVRMDYGLYEYTVFVYRQPNR